MRGLNQLVFRSLLLFFATALLPTTAPAEKVPAAQPTLPSVEFTIISGRDTVERGKPVSISAVIVNKSNTELKAVHIRSLDPKFPLDCQLASILPFESEQASVDMKTDENADFGQHRIGFLVDYDWTSESKQYRSAQTTTVTLSVQRPFEDEAKGLTRAPCSIYCCR